MIYMIISAVVIAAVIILLLRFSNGQKSKPLAKEDQPWSALIHQFKSVAPQFKTIEELEKYLTSINEQVRSHETDYAFLVEFNALIRQVRERLNVE